MQFTWSNEVETLMRKTMKVGGLAMALFLGAGCTGDVPNENEELCLHLSSGTGVPVTAVASGDASGAVVDDDHKRYEVALVDVEGGKGGMVTFNAAEAGDYVFALGADVPLALKGPDGATITFSGVQTGALGCPQLRKRLVAELPVGSTTLTFGPTTEPSMVPLVIEHLGEEGH
jgi:hypothetical protein